MVALAISLSGLGRASEAADLAGTEFSVPVWVAAVAFLAIGLLLTGMIVFCLAFLHSASLGTGRPTRIFRGR